MQNFWDFKSFALTIVLFSAAFVGCGGSGGGGANGDSTVDDEDDTTLIIPPDAFSPAAYEEATSANQNLSGIWMLLEEYQRDEDTTRYNYDASSDEVIHEHYDGKYRELYVIADSEISPTGTSRISSCSDTVDLSIFSTRLTFSHGRTSYIADYDNNTRITGTSSYSSAGEDYYGGGNTTVLETGKFTLVKIAPLPESFAVDASSDSAYISYADFIEPIGSLKATVSDANLFGTGPFRGPAAISTQINCFAHLEASYIRSDSEGSHRGKIVEFAGGTNSGGTDMYIHENQPEGQEASVDISGDAKDFWFDIDNDIDDMITGTSDISVEGTTNIKAHASISGAGEGDADLTIEITLP